MTNPNSLLHFEELMNTPQEQLHLDEACFEISSYLGSDIIPIQYCLVLDDLAKQCGGHTLADLSRFVFSNLGFKGNKKHYYDYQNCLLDHVLISKLGIPITLGIIVIELGRRLGIDLAGVSMPGHFLVKQVQGLGLILDPFEGKFLSLQQCASLFYASQGPNAALRI